MTTLSKRLGIHKFGDVNVHVNVIVHVHSTANADARVSVSLNVKTSRLQQYTTDCETARLCLCNSECVTVNSTKVVDP